MGKCILFTALNITHPSIILNMHEEGIQLSKRSFSVTDGIEYQLYEGGREWSFSEKQALRVSGKANQSWFMSPSREYAHSSIFHKMSTSISTFHMLVFGTKITSIKLHKYVLLDYF